MLVQVMQQQGLLVFILFDAWVEVFGMWFWMLATLVWSSLVQSWDHLALKR